jgi:L-2-hydroxyglutarate oxidase LhgO
MLYEICTKHAIACRRTEKLIVARDKQEEKVLPELLRRGEDNGVPGLRIISRTEIKELEPNIRAVAALHVPSTGILDSHSLMKYFIQSLKEKKGDIVYNSRVSRLRKIAGGYEVTIEDNQGEEFKFQAQVVINCAGLESDHIARMVGIKREEYNLQYCKGQYFRVRDTKKCSLINRLIYPIPQLNRGLLGIHATLDLRDGLRLGPDSRYITRDALDYNVDSAQRRFFLDSVIDFLPFLEEEDLIPDIAGVRARLQGEGEDFRDFVICQETAAGFPGFINLIGIDSPGLTCAPAIAAYVENMTKEII